MKHIALGIVLIVIGIGLFGVAAMGRGRRAYSPSANIWLAPVGGVVLVVLGILFATRAL